MSNPAEDDVDVTREARAGQPTIESRRRTVELHISIPFTSYDYIDAIGIQEERHTG